MLRLSFHMTVEADAIEAAIVKVLDDGYRTGDIMTPGGKRLSCSGGCHIRGDLTVGPGAA